ncbi:glycoside hydrolase superfamily [Bombardia bombarda]|uniref:Endoglucanase EG-II n=1 Tax=Bombardia bombarda TaxID=252184 RepID=A0AA39X0T2_9PEZI|nr:glycoside hydrolase superfamily [Bombardia bombarda]
MMLKSIICHLALFGLGSARVQFLGMSIAGGEFGCQIDGSCPLGSTQLPLQSFKLGGGDGEGQMKHFATDDGMNLFRLPISWQFLVNNQLGSPLNTANLAKYDKLVQTCLATGAHCMIDIHNFARWNGGIIGQGGPTDEQFVSLWTQLATEYAASQNIVFELMNEPHDLDIPKWAATCQKVVTAIRSAGAKTQMILLPGSNFDSAATLVSGGSAAALMAITNPDGSTDNLVLDVHKYLDVDNSGTHAECITNNTGAFGEVATFLRQAERKGLVSETGAAPDGSACLARFCEQNSFINANSDVFVGLVSWAAGSFDTSYLLAQTPRFDGQKWVNNQLAADCVVDTWLKSSEVVPAPAPVASSSSAIVAVPTITSTSYLTGTRTISMTGTITTIEIQETSSAVIESSSTVLETDESQPTTILNAPALDIPTTVETTTNSAPIASMKSPAISNKYNTLQQAVL